MYSPISELPFFSRTRCWWLNRQCHHWGPPAVPSSWLHMQTRRRRRRRKKHRGRFTHYTHWVCPSVASRNSSPSCLWWEAALTGMRWTRLETVFIPAGLRQFDKIHIFWMPVFYSIYPGMLSPSFSLPLTNLRASLLNCILFPKGTRLQSGWSSL